jgi:hypothetical protein
MKDGGLALIGDGAAGVDLRAGRLPCTAPGRSP